MTKSALLLGLCIAMCPAAVQAQWSPTVDTYGSSRAQFVTRDEQECRQIANQVAGSTSGNVARGAVGGGLLGAAAGAAIGAAAGGIGTGTVRGVQTNQNFQRAFTDCMRNRGHNVIR